MEVAAAIKQVLLQQYITVSRMLHQRYHQVLQYLLTVYGGRAFTVSWGNLRIVMGICRDINWKNP